MNDGIWIPADVWALDLPPLHRVFLARLVSLSKQDGASWAGDEFLAESLRCTPQHVRKMRGQLERSGHIVTEGYGHRRKLRVEVAPTGTSNHRNKQPEAQELQPQLQELQPQLRQEATTDAESKEEKRNRVEIVKKDVPKKEARPNCLDVVIDAFVDAGSTEEEANKYFDYYTANGWRVGRSPMKDWKAAARNWLRNASKFNSKNGKPQFTPEQQADNRAQLANYLRTGKV